MPSRIRHDDLLLRVLKDLNDVRSALKRVVATLPLFDIANENSVTLNSNQNNYVIGNYDVLRVNATTDIEITGLRGGLKGRFLEFINVGVGFIKFKNQDTASSAENRFSTPYDDDITIIKNSRVRFYYDSTEQRWLLADEPIIQGLYGKTAILTGSSQTIPNGVLTTLDYDTVQSDEWGYWNAANKRFEIPDGESGLYYIGHEGYWSTSFIGTSVIGLSIFVFGDDSFASAEIAGLSHYVNSNTFRITHSWIRRLGDNPGSYIFPQMFQNSLGGGDQTWASPSIYFSKIL